MLYIIQPLIIFWEKILYAVKTASCSALSRWKRFWVWGRLFITLWQNWYQLLSGKHVKYFQLFSADKKACCPASVSRTPKRLRQRRSIDINEKTKKVICAHWLSVDTVYVVTTHNFNTLRARSAHFTYFCEIRLTWTRITHNAYTDKTAPIREW